MRQPLRPAFSPAVKHDQLNLRTDAAWKMLASIAAYRMAVGELEQLGMLDAQAYARMSRCLDEIRTSKLAVAERLSGPAILFILAHTELFEKLWAARPTSRDQVTRDAALAQLDAVRQRHTERTEALVESCEAVLAEPRR